MSDRRATPWLAVGALLAALAIAAGAFGAHALGAEQGSRPRDLLDTGSRYLMYAALGLMLLGLAGPRIARPHDLLAGLALTIGSLVFFTTLTAMSLGAPSWLGAITPLGGLLMIAAFLVMAIGARPRH